MKRILTVALAACFLAAPAAHAQFVSLLKGGPAELFDDADLHLFLDAARKTLDQGAEGQSFAWENPKSSHRGQFTVVKAFQSKGRDCKAVAVHNEAQGRKSDMRHNLCRVDGRWRLVGDMKKGEAK